MNRLVRAPKSGAAAPVAAFFDRVLAQFEDAAEQGTLRNHTRRVGPWKIEQRHLGPGLEDLICPAFRHLPLLAGERADLIVYCGELESTSLDLGPMPWRRADLGRQGEIANLAATDLRASWDPEARTVQILDRRRAIGLVLVQSRRYFRSWDRSFPLRNILHWWAGPTAGQLMHAGALGTPEGGVLLLGAGGAGKSTTTLSCLGSALRIAGDDFVLVDGTPPATVYSLYGTAKLAGSTLARFPGLAARLGEPDGRIEEKSLFFLDRIERGALIERFPLKALLALDVVDDGDTRILPMSAAAALQACAPNTMFLLPGDGEIAFGKIARLTRSLPCYRLKLGGDLSQIPWRIVEFLDRL
jgi:hypothetical protein